MFLPPVFLKGSVKDFSGREAVSSSKEETLLHLLAEVTGLYFFIPIFSIFTFTYLPTN